MTIFLRSIVCCSPCIKSLSSLSRTKWTSGNMKISQSFFSSIATKVPPKTRATYLTVNQRSLQCCRSVVNQNFFGLVYNKPAFRSIYFSATSIPNDLRAYRPSHVPTNLFHSMSKKNKEQILANEKKDPEKSTNLIKKLKLMIKRYWYIYIPVHGLTSIMWFGGFYYAVKSGWDFKPFLEKIGNLQWLLDSLENSNMGYYAIAAALYKIATPIRYTVTVGGIAASVKLLKRVGYIKDSHMTKEELQYIYQDKKFELIDKTDEMREKYNTKKVQLYRRYQRRRDEIKKKNLRRIITLKNFYSTRRRDAKKKNAGGKKNGSKPNNGNRNGRNRPVNNSL